MKQNNPAKMRESGIELLRIIMMLQVIFLHVCVYGGYTAIAHDMSIQGKAFYELLYMSSRCPVYVYILIFGYFSVTSNKTLQSIKGKILKIYLPMLFYSLSISSLRLRKPMGRERLGRDSPGTAGAGHAPGWVSSSTRRRKVAAE